MKRGAIEIQFNWIFILIIGAIILLFFFSIVKTQKTISEKKISSTVRTDIKTILAGATVSTGTTSLIEIPKVEIKYDCTGYYIQDTAAIKQSVSFSPDSIYDINLMLWALDWNIGYRVTNFLYITSPSIRYILVYKSNDETQLKFADMLNETLPSRYIEEYEDKKILMNKDKMELFAGNTIDGLEDANNPKLRFVFFGDTNPTSLKIEDEDILNMDDYDVTAVVIEPDASCGENLDCFGKVIYYKKDKDKLKHYEQTPPASTTYYLRMPSLIGAVFSDLDTYECNMKRAFEKLNLVTKIYINKTKVLEEHYTETMNYPCLTVMNTIESILNDIHISSEEFTEENVEDIYNKINELEEMNDRAIKLSCAEVY